MKSMNREGGDGKHVPLAKPDMPRNGRVSKKYCDYGNPSHKGVERSGTGYAAGELKQPRRTTVRVCRSPKSRSFRFAPDDRRIITSHVVRAYVYIAEESKTAETA